ncbi:flagellar basal body L-ring protein FlgH [Herbaspirillum lusitanum]|jgi:flagellar L-ring protein precursor FlgH|uniref:Flagellar basal body L-ring protein FlgH n=1 Tax=Herbaspirillum lusitanum TaxID=213312 RepID=A0ABW9ADR9_9BURK
MKLDYRLIAGLSLAGLMCACTSPAPLVSGPTSVRSAYPVANVENNGSIFRVSSAQLFEEPTTHNVGDILKIQISETLTGSNKSTTTNSRDSSMSQTGLTGGNSLSTMLSSLFNARADYTAAGANSFKGSGQTDNANSMSGTLMVSIIEVLPNSNLVVAGEKRIGMNGSVNTLRFSGVIRNRDIRNGVVESANVADARLEQVGGGSVADANSQSWMQQFFRNVLSFW